MAFDATTILELVVLITWTCIQQPTWRNALFKVIFFDAIILTEVARAACLSFCPGLFEVIQAATPPGLDWFRRLPNEGRGRWGVYVLILEKPGFLPFIYIGSGTDATLGVLRRWAQYDRLDWAMLPVWVVWALQNGYIITYKGLIVWCPIPPARLVPKVRLLFVGMECGFTFCFWAMKSKIKDYGMAMCCPWSRELFEYGGLCSHSSLSERVAGRFDLTDEQLEAMAAEAKEKRKQHNAKQYKRIMQVNPEGHRAKKRVTAKTYRENSADKKRANEERFRERAKDEKRFYCKTYGVTCISNWELDRHNKSHRHKLAIKRSTNGKLRFHCKLCDSHFTHQCHLDRHKRGQRHLEKAAAARSSNSI